MPDTDHTTIEHQRAVETVRLLRKQLADLGLPDAEVRQVVPQTDFQRRAYVRLGVLPVASAEKLLRALTVAEPAS